jgi:ferredoxin--NADP+ reductase
MLMIGVGTGIAPFRAFMKHIYDERKEWKGKVRLFYGAKTGMDLLYMNDKNADLSLYYDKETFQAFKVLSPRPHFDEPEQIEQSLKEHSKEVWDLVQDPNTYIYVSGLSRLEARLDKTMEEFAGSEADWLEMKKELVASGRWSTLFYD